MCYHSVYGDFHPYTKGHEGLPKEEMFMWKAEAGGISQVNRGLGKIVRNLTGWGKGCREMEWLVQLSLRQE